VSLKITILTLALQAARERDAAKECLHREMNMSRGNLSQFGNITKGPPMAMVMRPSGVFWAGKNSERETLSRTNSSSNMFHMLSQNPELAVKAKSSRSPSQKPSIYRGHDGVSEHAVQHRKLRLLLRSVLAAEENSATSSEEEPESAPTVMSKADVKKEIDRYVREFFAVRNLEEAEVYFTNLPNELCFRLVDNREAYMSCGGLRSGSDKERNPNDCVSPGGSVPWEAYKSHISEHSRLFP
jgi:hypothetical protein